MLVAITGGVVVLSTQGFVQPAKPLFGVSIFGPVSTIPKSLEIAFPITAPFRAEYATVVETSPSAALQFLDALPSREDEWSNCARCAYGGGEGEGGSVDLIRYTEGPVYLVELHGGAIFDPPVLISVPPSAAGHAPCWDFVSAGNVAFYVDRVDNGLPVGGLLAELPNGWFALGSLGRERTVPVPAGTPVHRVPASSLVFPGERPRDCPKPSH